MLLGLLLAGLLMRVTRLAALPIFLDESLYTRAAQVIAAHPGPATLFTLESPAYGGNPPLFAWLAAPIVHLVPDPLLAARLASALVGTLGLLATWAAGRATWGAGAGLLAAGCYALSPFLLFYDRMALLDGTVATCGAGALFWSIRLSRRGRMRDAAALGLCILAGLLTKVLAVSLLLLPLLAAATAPAALRRATWRGAAVAGALAVPPFGWLLLHPYHNDPLSFALHGHLQASGGAWGVSGVIATQVRAATGALWLYLTPPLLLLAVPGLVCCWREPGARLVGAWAMLGALPVVLIPNRFFVPRHVLYIAVPCALLAARGLLALPAALNARRASGALSWPLLAGATALAVAPSVAADAIMIGAPAQTPLIAPDRFQYVTGWPSGYILQPVVAYLRRQAVDGRVAVVSEDSNPPLYMLQIAFNRDPGVTVVGGDVDRAEPLRSLLARVARAGPGPIYVIAHHSSDRRTVHHGLSLLAAQGVLHLVLRSRSPAHGGDYELYRVTV